MTNDSYSVILQKLKDAENSVARMNRYTECTPFEKHLLNTLNDLNHAIHMLLDEQFESSQK